MAEAIEIQVRSLSGESTTISISPNKSVLDLKLLLRNCFAPASANPNFHLFLKGVKLNLHSQISSHCYESGEFIVFAPFTKKNRQQTHIPDEAASASPAQNQSITSAFADSAYSAMMQDLSSLQNISSTNSQLDIEFETRPSDSKSDVVGNENEEKIEKMISNMLQSFENCVIDEKNCESFVQALESQNCLTDPISKTCMSIKDNLNNQDENTACLCPLWLKTIMKAFSFLNIYSVFLQLVRRKITLNSMEAGLNQLNKFGFEIRLPDLKNLSLLCPKVVHFVDNEAEGKTFRNSLVIIKSQLQEEDQTEGKPKKVMNISKSITAMGKREISFKKNLWSGIKSLMKERGNEMASSYSLEDLLVHLKESSCNSSAKRPGGNSSATSSTSFEYRCPDMNPLLPVEMIDHLRKGIGSQGQIVHVEEIGRRQAKFVEIPSELSEETKSALKHLGITSLYSHQAESIQATLASKHVVISTMTSSGKSLCYNLPVLEALSQDISACALYLFPTKALAQDQLRAISAMTKGLDTSLNIGIYDGDTCQGDRTWLRDNVRLLITNPDMLHMSILPFHGQFSRLLTNLRYVVIDEAHAYKGAFGCHTALILRRLRRLCSHVYGSDPSFVFCTATLANPREHAMELASLSTIELIENDGSPSAPKHFVLWNPPLCMKTVPKRMKRSAGTEKSAHNIVVVKRSSPIMELSCLFAEIVQHGLRCIAFCKSRRLCELVLSYTREILQETAPCLADRICAYRAGYIAEDRRKIESEFFGGTLCGVAATNALELGIDVGHIDVTLHLGFPGSISSLWQQAGRSGRREKASLAIYVAFESPLDQYFMNFPHKLFSSPIECCHIDAKNQQVLEQHLACAAAEHPLSLIHDEKYFSHGLEISVMNLKAKGLLCTDPSSNSSSRIWNYIGHEKKPAHGISIRAIETEKYQIVDKQKNEVIEEIEESKAFFQIHEGAVYMHQGRTYLVNDLNLSSKIASCQRADLKYYTKTRDFTDIYVNGGKIAYARKNSKDKISRTTAQACICKVTTRVFGFRRIWKGTNQVFDTAELSLPDYSFESKAVWIQVPHSVKKDVETKDYSFRGGLHAACHALLNVVPIYIICNSSDIASECVNPDENHYYPERLLLYDPHPGGTGMSAQVQPIFTDLLTAAKELLESCHCSGDTGCPKCVQNLSCHEYNESLHKDAAVMIIKGILEAEKSHFAEMDLYHDPHE